MLSVVQFLFSDNEELQGHDLFIAFLSNCQLDRSVKQIHLISYENPPSFYLKGKNVSEERVTCHNYFEDPVGWNTSTAEKSDLSFFISNLNTYSENVLFIDSLSFLVHYHGFLTAYKNLSVLKNNFKKILCLAHGDLFPAEKLEQLYFLSNAFVKLLGYSLSKNCDEKLCEVTFKKAGGKVVKQKEEFVVSKDLKVRSSPISKAKALVVDKKIDMEDLTTFKLGIKMSETEKKAREELVLPYLKTNKDREGGILYQPEADELEDDPDDDLDI